VRRAEPPKENRPLAESDNERARELVALDELFVTDIAQMPPEASSYFRRRPFLTPEVCRQWRIGYLPQSAKSLLRGKIVYGYSSADGELLTWFGRDPRYEQKSAAWKASDRTDPEPIKTQFVKGFHRGLELYGEHAVRRAAGEGRKSAAGIGLILVEGPNDAIRLHTLNELAVAVCSNTITREQSERAARLAREVDNGTITLLLDCDEEGEQGAQQALALLAEYAPVRLGWSRTMFGGRYKDRQPESVSGDDWRELVP
jgi:DNA primase